MSACAAVELEQSAEALDAVDRSPARQHCPSEKLVADTLVIPLPVAVRQVLVDDALKMRLAEHDYPVQALVFD